MYQNDRYMHDFEIIRNSSAFLRRNAGEKRRNFEL